MKRIICFLILLTAFYNSNAQNPEWLKLNSPRYYCNILHVDQDGVFWAQTKNYSDSIRSAYDIFSKSTDGGRTWLDLRYYYARIFENKLGMFGCGTGGINIYDYENHIWDNISFNLTNPNYLNLFYNDDSLVYFYDRQCIYKLNLENENWDSIYRINGYYIDDGGFTIAKNGNHIISIFYNDTNRLIVSSNKGLSWDTVFTPKDNIVYLNTSPDGSIYLGTKSANWIQLKLYRSDDFGYTWKLLSAKNYNLIIDKNGSLFLCYNKRTIVFSNDKGESWTTIYTDSSSDNMYNYDYGIVFSNDRTIILNHYQQPRISMDYGKSWKFLELGKPIDNIQKILLSNNEQNIFVSMFWGVWLSTDFGESWERKIMPCSSQVNTICKDYYGNIYEMNTQNSTQSCYNSAISRNNGKTWEFSKGLGKCIDMDFIIDTNYFIGYFTGGVFKGDFYNRTAINVGLPVQSIFSIEVLNNEEIIIGPKKHCIYKTTNKGDSWFKSSDGIPDSVTISNIEQNIRGVILSAVKFETEDTLFSASGLYRSLNNGYSWQQCSDDYGLNNISTIAVAPNGDFIISEYGNSSRGLFKSTDDGLTWEHIDGEFDNNQINTIAITDDYKLYVGTNSGSIYRTIKSMDVWDNSITGKSIKVFPNPTSSNLNIQINNIESGNISLKLFDIFGREVGTVFDGISNGNLNLNHNIENIYSGTYFLVLTTKSGRTAERVVISN